MYIPASILNKFIHGAWQGLTKIQEYYIVDKHIISFYAGEGPTYCLIIKNLKIDKYYQVEYTVIYKESRFIHNKVKMKPIIEVFPDKKEITVYKTEKQLLEDIHKKFEEFYGQEII